MPSKIQVDENLVFLYRCLVNSDSKTIDFNAVGAATNLNAPAARMRYSRLKKSIETKLGENSKKDPVASIKPLPFSTSIQVTKKAKPGPEPSRKRKALHESEDEEPHTPTLDEKIGNGTIGDEGLEEWTAGWRTRGKKINLKDAFDSDSSTGPKLRNEDHVSSDEYEIEEVSEGEEEYHADEAEDEDNQPASRRRKRSSQAASRKMGTAKSTIKVFKNPSKAIPHFVPDKYANETVSKPGSPVTPESGLSGRSETKGKSITLPPTPKSMRTGAVKAESADWASTAPNARTDAPPLSPAAKLKKITPASPEPSLFDRIENARVRADHNLAFLSYQPDRTSRSYIKSPKTTTETVLPSIEHDDDKEEDSAMLHVSSRASARSSRGSSDAEEGRRVASEFSHSTVSTAQSRSSAAPSPVPVNSEPTARVAAAATAWSGSGLQASAGTAESCIVQ